MNSDNPLNPNNNTPEAKSIRTFLQAAAASAVAFFYGLWQLPGVSDYVHNFVETQGYSLLFGLAALVGVPAAVIAYFQNRRARV